MITLSKLFIHPVKSMRGLQLSQLLAERAGPAFDRAFMVTAPDGTFITARQLPQMVQFTPALLPDGLFIAAPDGDSAVIRYDEFSATESPTEVWGNQFTARIAPEAINRWLSGYLSRDVQLRWLGPTLSRRVKGHPDTPLTFADGYPFLLVNEASLEELRRRCPAGIKLEQFRPNLVVTGAGAFAEDSWAEVRVGSVVFEAVKPCSRCVLTTVSTERGVKHPGGEPLKTLQTFRTAPNGDVDFGMNLIARNSGIIRAGDEVEVLATCTPRTYGTGKVSAPLAPPAPAAPSAQAVAITYQGQRFTGNKKEVLLDQLEQQGFRIPYSCRAGLCGSCRLTLEGGKVAPLVQDALGDDGTLLSCSCIPLEDVTLS
ncbi:hypothetical protein CYR32_00760 [Chimaeribacter coloradensis]|uniref:MOSC domain-containing protein n=1 Tax=Chimaeribacter coloradensis TaxID=2060068 RepID=A0A2N5ECS2_9GAMM|nr:YcbX family protein [Chimaeribacter coloradensis]PLR40306.1 hypothetical protein CYR32_00760 [Chimaeribacter coloradensis]